MRCYVFHSSDCPTNSKSYDLPMEDLKSEICTVRFNIFNVPGYCSYDDPFASVKSSGTLTTM